MRTTTTLLALVATLLATGCGVLGQRSSWDPFATTSERRLVINVQNRSVDDVTVNVLVAGRRESLGMITGRSHRQFSLSWSRAENVQFQLEPVAGRRHTVGGGVVRPGDRLDLYVQDPITRSFVSR
jgi:hypothetical protein